VPRKPDAEPSTPVMCRLKPADLRDLKSIEEYLRNHHGGDPSQADVVRFALRQTALNLNKDSEKEISSTTEKKGKKRRISD
jgi:hypothetical protein